MSKVVIITNIPSPYSVDLYYHLQTNITAHEFHVIYTNRNEDNRVWDIPKEKLINTQILNAKVIKIRNSLDTRYVHIPANISKVLGQLNPDVILAMEYNPAAIQALMWAKIHRKGFVHWTEGTLHSERSIGFAQKLTRRLICNNADACIASSTKSKEKLLFWGVAEDRIFTSLLTVDISKFRKVERDPVRGRILYVGSMIPRKGLDLLVEALKYVEHDFKLHIVGNGTQDEIRVLKEAAQANGIADSVVFCGFKQGDALTEEYQKAQVFVLPTREDCFGLVLLEAMCAGVPIVASKYADGAYDVITEGVNGFIEDPFDPKVFGKAIGAALEMKESFTEEYSDRAEAFTFDAVSKGIESAIRYAETAKSMRSNNCNEEN